MGGAWFDPVADVLHVPLDNRTFQINETDRRTTILNPIGCPKGMWIELTADEMRALPKAILQWGLTPKVDIALVQRVKASLPS